MRGRRTRTCATTSGSRRPDNIQGPGLAQYAYNDLGKRTAYVVDDTEAFGVGVANTLHRQEFQSLGGTIAKRDSNDYRHEQGLHLAADRGAGDVLDVVFFGGTQVTGGGQLRKDDGRHWDMLDIPLRRPGRHHRPAAGLASRARSSPSRASRTRATCTARSPGIHDIPDPEAFRHRLHGGVRRSHPGAYSALAYACTQIIIAVARERPSRPAPIRRTSTRSARPSGQRSSAASAVRHGARPPERRRERRLQPEVALVLQDRPDRSNDGDGWLDLHRQRDFAGAIAPASPQRRSQPRPNEHVRSKPGRLFPGFVVFRAVTDRRVRSAQSREAVDRRADPRDVTAQFFNALTHRRASTR